MKASNMGACRPIYVQQGLSSPTEDTAARVEAVGSTGCSIQSTTLFAAKQARAYLEVNCRRQVSIRELCNEIGIASRTLHHAFRDCYKTSPIRYHNLHRLKGARGDLIRSGPGVTTVTRIALDWGFEHFGRFSLSYKAVFGEVPSHTLCRER